MFRSFLSSQEIAKNAGFLSFRCVLLWFWGCRSAGSGFLVYYWLDNIAIWYLSSIQSESTRDCIIIIGRRRLNVGNDQDCRLRESSIDTLLSLL